MKKTTSLLAAFLIASAALFSGCKCDDCNASHAACSKCSKCSKCTDGACKDATCAKCACK